MDGLRSVFKSLIRTAVIVAPLGIALYLLLAWLTGRPDMQFWLTIFLTVPSGGFLGYYLLDSVRTGKVSVGRQAIGRAQQPVAYWMWMAWFSTMTILLLVLSLGAAVRLIAG